MADRLVVDGVRRHGRLEGRPTVVDPLDGVRGARRMLRRLRLKEWVGFALIHPDVWVSMIVQDAKYLCSSEVFAYDSRDGVMRHHEVITRPGAARLPTRLHGSSLGMTRPGYEVGYRFAGPTDRHQIAIAIEAKGSTPRVEGHLELHGASAPPPLSVSAPLPGGSMFTYKAIYPVEGSLQIGDREHQFDPDRDVAILDEHRSFLPYRTAWTWGTFATLDTAEIVGANFAARPTVPGSEEESCIWSPAAVEPLSDIDFEQLTTDPLGRWQVRSGDGRLDVTFEPVHRQAVKHQLGLFAIDYFMLYGRYRGTLVTNGRTREIDDVHGVCERMKARL